MVKAQGYTYDAKTRDWTTLVEYEARDRMDAIRWMNFNKDWMKGLRIVENIPEGMKRPLGFYTV